MKNEYDCVLDEAKREEISLPCLFCDKNTVQTIRYEWSTEKCVKFTGQCPVCGKNNTNNYLSIREWNNLINPPQ